MVEKKEHHLTKAKRLREEAETAPVIELARTDVVAPIEIVVSEPVTPVKKVNGPYWVYNSRANLINRVFSEDEAKVFLRGFPGGFWNMGPEEFRK